MGPSHITVPILDGFTTWMVTFAEQFDSYFDHIFTNVHGKSGRSMTTCESPVPAYVMSLMNGRLCWVV